jgi:hypothetical protein
MYLYFGVYFRIILNKAEIPWKLSNNQSIDIFQENVPTFVEHVVSSTAKVTVLRVTSSTNMMALCLII